MRPVEALLEGRLDLAIVTPAIHDQQVRVRPLFDHEHVAIVAPKSSVRVTRLRAFRGFCAGASAAV